MANPQADVVARRLVILKYQVVQGTVMPPVVRMASKDWPEAEQKKLRLQLEQNLENLRSGFLKLGLWEFLSDSEEKFFSTNPLDFTDQQSVNASWRIESVMVLMWALNIISEMCPFDVQASLDLLKQIPHENLSGFFSNSRLTDEAVIKQERDCAELWHWRSRTRELIEKGVTPGILGDRSLDDIVRTTAIVAHKNGDLLDVKDEDFSALGKAYRDLTAEEWSSVSTISFERHFALNWLCGAAPDNRWDETPTDT